jgi:hypothetical protein
MFEDKLILSKLPYWKTVAHLEIFADRIDLVVLDLAEAEGRIDGQKTNYRDILRIITKLSRYFHRVQN